MRPKKAQGHNTVAVPDVDLTDPQLATLAAIIASWNQADPTRQKPWDANSVLGALVGKYLDVLEADYAPGARPPTFPRPQSP